MTVWCTHIACRIPNATNTLSEYVILLIFHCFNDRTNPPPCYVHYIFCIFLLVSETLNVKITILSVALFGCKFIFLHYFLVNGSVSSSSCVACNTGIKYSFSA